MPPVTEIEAEPTELQFAGVANLVGFKLTLLEDKTVTVSE